MNFFFLIFPCEYFFCTSPAPDKFSNGPFLNMKGRYVLITVCDFGLIRAQSVLRLIQVLSGFFLQLYLATEKLRELSDNQVYRFLIIFKGKIRYVLSQHLYLLSFEQDNL